MATTRRPSSARCSRPISRRERGGGFEAEFVEERPGFVAILFEGRGARRLFEGESGGHRWQRVPPNDKHGRVQTSTVTVATLDPELPVALSLRESDVDIQKTRGSGPGGQARNKLETCVVVTHRETGITVRVDMRSQHQSKAMAMRILAARLHERATTSAANERGAIRRAQVGTGMRGDKVRRTGRRTTG